MKIVEEFHEFTWDMIRTLPMCYYNYVYKIPFKLRCKPGLSDLYHFVENIEDADFILGCTTSPGLRTLDYVPLLEKAIQKNIPFICANPDYETVESSTENFIICMGAVAALYKDFGGSVFIMGKPSIEIYREATKNFKKITKKRMLAIGDSIHHDIKGAENFGIDSLLITSGIHKSIFDQSKPIWDNEKNNLLKYKIKPTYMCSKFQF